MADRYQGNRSYRADDGYDRAHNQAAPQATDSDPLAELARLIGQTDPFSTFARDGRAAPAAHHDEAFDNEAPDVEPQSSRSTDFDVRPGRPSWMQRVAQRETPHEESYDDPAPAVQPPADPYAQSHAADPYQGHYQHQQDDHYQQQAVPQGYGAADHGHDPAYGQQQPDPSRYDEVLYGPSDDQQAQHYAQEAGYSDEAYEQGYDEEAPPAKKRGGMVTVIMVVALAFVGVAGAYAYRSFVGSPRTGEVPIIKADTSPNKIVLPSQQQASDNNAGKPIQDRVGTAPGAERIVSREEQPVDVNTAKATGPRVVFPALTQNPNPNPAGASTPAMAPSRPATGGASGNLAGDEPRKIRTLAIRPDQADIGAPPRPAPTRAAAPAPAAQAPAAANAPMPLTPQAQPRMASNAPVATTGSTGGYVVQISSQRSEADAQASYRALQNKFPNVLGSRAPLIKRADLGDKGVYYRAMVGPFAGSDEASQFCGSLKSAGGQCVVQRN